MKVRTLTKTGALYWMQDPTIWFFFEAWGSWCLPGACIDRLNSKLPGEWSWFCALSWWHFVTWESFSKFASYCSSYTRRFQCRGDSSSKQGKEVIRTGAASNQTPVLCCRSGSTCACSGKAWNWKVHSVFFKFNVIFIISVFGFWLYDYAICVDGGMLHFTLLIMRSIELTLILR